MGANSEAEAELQARIRQLEAVAALGQQALGNHDLDGLMAEAVAVVAECLDTEYAKVLELLPGGEDVLLRQGVGWQDGLVGTAAVSTDLTSQAGYTLISEEPVIVEDLRSEARFSGPPLLTDHGVVSGISVVIGSVEDPWGVLGTHTQDRRTFTDDDVTFVRSVANVLAAAIEQDASVAELAESERRFRQVAENIREIVWMSDADREELLYVNPRYESIWGRSVESLYDEPTSFLEAVHPDDRARVEAAIAEQADGTYDEEYRIVPRTGEIRWVHDRAVPIHDDAGEVYRIVGITQDVTERKEYEQELERTRELLANAERLAAIGGWEVDLQSGAVTWTDEMYRLHEVPETFEPTLETAIAFFHDDDVPTIREGIDRCVETGESAGGDVRLITASGTERWVHVEVEPLERDGDDGPRRLRGSMQDVTATVERDHQLALLERVLRHNLRNDMNVVLGNAATIASETSGEVQAAAETIVEVGTGLVDLADKNRKIARVLSGPAETYRYDLTAVVADVVEEAREAYPHADVRFDPDGPIHLRTVPQLGEAVAELLENAVEHSDRETPTVVVECEGTDESVEIRVADDGPGIPETELTILDREAETDPTSHGTGMALWVVKWIVHRTRGTLSFEENTPRGSIVRIRLPRDGED